MPSPAIAGAPRQLVGAVRLGFAEDVRRLLAESVAPHSETVAERSDALIVAVHAGHLDLAKLLLACSADPLRGSVGRRPIDIAKKIGGEAPNLLLSFAHANNGADERSAVLSALSATLHDVARSADAGLWRVILRSARSDAWKSSTLFSEGLRAVDDWGRSCVHLCLQASASAADRAASLRVLLEVGECDLNAATSMGETPLILAMRIAIGEALRTSFHDECDILRLLLEGQADPNIPDIALETPLMEAACSGNEELCKLLLEFHADVSARTPSGLRAVDLVSGLPEIARLVDMRSSSNACDTSVGNSQRVSSAAQTEDGRGVVRECFNDSSWESACQAVAEIDALKLSGVAGMHDVIVERNDDGLTLLHLSVQTSPSPSLQQDICAVVNVLLLAKADLSVRNVLGETPLVTSVHAAIGARSLWTSETGVDDNGVGGRLGVVSALLTAAADANSCDDFSGESPLMEAVCEGDVQLCRLLLSSKADPTLQSGSGMVAVEFLDASDVHSSEIAELLALPGHERPPWSPCVTEEFSAGNTAGLVAESQVRHEGSLHDPPVTCIKSPHLVAERDQDVEPVDTLEAMLAKLDASVNQEEEQLSCPHADSDAKNSKNSMESDQAAVKPCGSLETPARATTFPLATDVPAAEVLSEGRGPDVPPVGQVEKLPDIPEQSRHGGSPAPEARSDPQAVRGATIPEGGSVAESSPGQYACSDVSHEDKSSVLHQAVCGADPAGIRQCLQSAEDAHAWLLKRVEDKSTFLHKVLALRPDERVAESVSVLLSFKAELEPRNVLGETPLHIAVHSALDEENEGRMQAVLTLLENRANPNLVDALLGENPLMKAACRGDVQLCEVLLRFRADPAHASTAGLTAFEFAEGEGHGEVCKVLRAARVPNSRTRATREPGRDSPKRQRRRSGSRDTSSSKDENKKTEGESRRDPSDVRQTSNGFQDNSKTTLEADAAATESAEAPTVVVTLRAKNQPTVEVTVRPSAASEVTIRDVRLAAQLRLSSREGTSLRLHRHGFFAPPLADSALLRGTREIYVSSTSGDSTPVGPPGAARTVGKLREECVQIGLPLGPDTNTEALGVMLETAKSWERASVSELKRKCTAWCIPIEGLLEKSEMVVRLKQVLVWKHMSVTALQGACRRLRLQASLVCGTQDAEKAALVMKLIQHTFGPVGQSEAPQAPSKFLEAVQKAWAGPSIPTAATTPTTPSQSPWPGAYSVSGSKDGPSKPATNPAPPFPPRPSPSAAAEPDHTKAKAWPTAPSVQKAPRGAAQSRQRAATVAPGHGASTPVPRQREARSVGPKPRQTGKGRPRGKLEREAVDSEDEDLLGASFKSLGPRARKTIKEFSSYSGEMPPPEAEETWSDIDFHNFFFSGGFIKPKKKAKPKPSPVLMREHYKTLGIQEGCKGDEVRRIYRKLALKYHPDKNLGTDENTSKFQDITEAYEAVCAQLHEMEQETEKWP